MNMRSSLVCTLAGHSLHRSRYSDNIDSAATTTFHLPNS